MHGQQTSDETREGIGRHSLFNARAEHRTVYGIRPYAYGANTVTGTPVTVTVQVALEVVDGTVRV